MKGQWWRARRDEGGVRLVMEDLSDKVTLDTLNKQYGG